MNVCKTVIYKIVNTCIGDNRTSVIPISKHTIPIPAIPHEI